MMDRRAALDTAWTLAVLGAMAYYLRAEIGRTLTAARIEADRRTAIAEEAARTIDSRRGFLAYLRARGIEPSRHDLGMES